MTTRIAMWCGPRTISTAMMRAWENRPDTHVCDEPLYAYYLHQTGLQHPGRAAIVASQPTDWRRVADHLSGPIPDGRAVWYQKHMAHHLLPEVDRAWLLDLRHCFLIRDPAAIIASYVRSRPEVTLPEIGIVQQLELFNWLQQQAGPAPVVLDSRDVREDPAASLQALCRAMDVPWTDAMLSWPPGSRCTDGVWAEHWYANVERSTGFAPYVHREPAVPAHLAHVAAEAEVPYQRLLAHRLAI